MKTFAFVVVLLAPAVLAQSTAPVILETGPHHRVIEWVEEQVAVDGQRTAEVHQYTELATGLHYQDEATGEWLESVAAFELLPQGYAVAARGQHKVILAGNINAGGSVDLELPDGRRMLSNPMGLSYFDAASGRNVLLAEVKDCAGEQVAPNMILFPDAFDTLKAALRYTYTLAGFEQDVILLEDPGPPELYGLNPATTTLEIYTEFFEAPEPAWETVGEPEQLRLDSPVGRGEEFGGTGPEGRSEGVGEADAVLDFGSMRMERGTAYFLHRDVEDAGLAKSWEHLEGRQFLIERIAYEEIAPLLDKLPLRTARLEGEGLRQRTTSGRRGFADLVPRRGQGLELAMMAHGSIEAAQGVVLDYVTLNSNQTDYTFRGDMTYRIAGPVYLYGTTVLEGGAVIKFDAGSDYRLYSMSGTVDCQTSSYRPAVFTAKDDNSVGMTIAGSTGNPSGNYAEYALRCWNPTGALRLEHLQVRHARYGLLVVYREGHTIRHCQLVDCWRPIWAQSATLQLHNVLIDQARDAAIYFYDGSTATGEHLTIHRAHRVVYPSNQLTLTNSLLVGVTNWTYAFNGAHNATNSSGAVFQPVGAGHHYLPPGSPYRNAGTPHIDVQLAADLRRRTTCAPAVLSGDFTASVVLAPQAGRGGPLPSLGYHYAPLDYCWSELQLGNATLTLTQGVAVAWYGPKGVILGAGARFISEGRPENLNRLVRYAAVQEQSAWWGSSHGLTGILEQGGGWPVPEVRLGFTEVTALGGAWSQQQLLANPGAGGLNPLALSHCQLHGLYLQFDDSAMSGYQTVAWTNNLVERCKVYWNHVGNNPPFALHLYHNLFRGGITYFHTASSGYSLSWTVRDNLFDSDTLNYSGAARMTVSHNGFRVGLTSLGGSGNRTGLVPEYQTGPLGRFYYPASGGGSSLTNLVNAGSRNAANAGLYHFTTTVAHGKETNSIVDIGFHYVALEPTAGLVAHWKFDEGSGTFASDATGLGHGGTLLGGASWTAGQLGGALSLDGIDGRVEASESTALRLAWDKTLALWIKKHAEPAGYPHIFGKGGSSYYGRGYHLWDDTGAGARLIWEQGYASGVPTSLFSTTALSTNQWYHVAGVIEGSRIRLYLNGTLDAAGSLSGTPVARTDPVRMGHLSGFTHFPGLLDDVRVYHRALSAGEIAGLAARPNWHYDTDGDGIPDYLEDRNGNGTVDSGETNWQQSENGTTGVPGLQVFPPLE